MRVIYVLDRLMDYRLDPDGDKALQYFDDPGGKRPGVYWGEQPHVTFEAFYKLGAKGYQFEVWLPDPHTTVPHRFVHPSGVVHLLLPGTTRGTERIQSPALLEALAATDPSDTLVITGAMHRPLSRQVLQSLPLHKKIVQLRGAITTPLARMRKKGLLGLIMVPDALREHRRWKRTLANADAVFYQARQAKRALKPYFEGSFFQNETGIDEPAGPTNAALRAQLRARYGMPIGAPVLLSSSRIVPHKQLVELVKAFETAAVPGAHLVLTGRGEADYEEKIREAGSRLLDEKRLHLPGHVTGRTLWDWYRLSDVFINSSLAEGGPVSSKKALAVGLPVITTPSGTVYEYLQESNSGLTLPTRDYDAWPALLRHVLAHPTRIPTPPVAESITRFGWEGIMHTTLDVYQQVMARSQSASQRTGR